MRLKWSSIRAITKHPINYVLCDTRVLSPIPPFHQRNRDLLKGTILHRFMQLHACFCGFNSQTMKASIFAVLNTCYFRCSWEAFLVCRKLCFQRKTGCLKMYFMSMVAIFWFLWSSEQKKKKKTTDQVKKISAAAVSGKTPPLGRSHLRKGAFAQTPMCLDWEMSNPRCSPDTPASCSGCVMSPLQIQYLSEEHF